MYKLLPNIDPFTKQVFEPNMVLKDGNLWIPFNPDNTDYQAYLAWLAEGNEVLPPDEPQQEQ